MVPARETLVECLTPKVSNFFEHAAPADRARMMQDITFMEYLELPECKFYQKIAGKIVTDDVLMDRIATSCLPYFDVSLGIDYSKISQRSYIGNCFGIIQDTIVDNVKLARYLPDEIDAVISLKAQFYEPPSADDILGIISKYPINYRTLIISNIRRYLPTICITECGLKYIIKYKIEEQYLSISKYLKKEELQELDTFCNEIIRKSKKHTPIILHP